MHNRNTKHTSSPDAARTQRIIADQQWACDHSLELARRYPNQWVAIHDRHVILTDPDELRAKTRALAHGKFPITFVHTCPPRIPSAPDAVVASLALDAIPADIRANGRPIDARALTTELHDLRYRSVSFDLHGTLVCSHIGWDERIADAFRSVRTAHGFDDVPRRIETIHGARAAAVVTAIAKNRYNQAVSCTVLPEVGVKFFDPANTWPIANLFAIGDLIGTFGDPDRCPPSPPSDPEFPLLARRLFARDEQRTRPPITAEHASIERSLKVIDSRDRARKLDLEHALLEFLDMAIAVHERLSGSAPEDWYPTEEQRAVLRTALEHGHLCCVLSNGSAEAVQRCVATHLPGIPPWQVFTPETFHCAGKPSPVNAALLLASMSAAMVRNAIEGRRAPDPIVAAVRERDRSRWQRAHVRLTRAIATSLDPARGDTALTIVRGALEEFARALRLPPSAREAITILPHEHLHVGNSDYHDELPMLGLGLPFHCVQYAPADTAAPACAVRPFPTTALHPVPGFDDRNKEL